jgi:hypothetical protein
MMSNRILLILAISTGVVASALALGCSDRPGVTDPTTAAAPSLEAAVSRFDAPFFNAVLDSEHGLTALFGFTFEELPAACAGAEPLDLAHYLIVEHPTRGDETFFHFRVTDEEQSAIIWAAIPEGSVCDLQGLQPLAVGTVQFSFTDNDFFNAGPDTESVGFQAEGTVISPATGQRYHLLAKLQVLIFNDGTLRLVANSVRLTSY